jgi:hypothetical protein
LAEEELEDGGLAEGDWRERERERECEGGKNVINLIFG